MRLEPTSNERTNERINEWMNEWERDRQKWCQGEKTPKNMMLFCNALIRIANEKHTTSICYKSHQSHLLKAVRLFCHIEIPACLILLASSSTYANYNFSCFTRTRCVNSMGLVFNSRHSVAKSTWSPDCWVAFCIKPRNICTCYRKWEIHGTNIWVKMFLHLHVSIRFIRWVAFVCVQCTCMCFTLCYKPEWHYRLTAWIFRTVQQANALLFGPFDRRYFKIVRHLEMNILILSPN